MDSKKKQTTTADVVIMDGAVVCGDVTIGKGSSVWFNAVVRGDMERIRIGEDTNIQECSVLHVDENCPLTIGNGVTVGHGAILHGCTVGDRTVIGMGAILLNGCTIGENCIIGAGTLITQGMHIPAGSVVMGNPGRVKRQVTEEEKIHNMENAKVYIRHAAKQL